LVASQNVRMLTTQAGISENEQVIEHSYALNSFRQNVMSEL
jgi:hypothetical protein